jgi:hypothetical protein
VIISTAADRSAGLASAAKRVVLFFVGVHAERHGTMWHARCRLFVSVAVAPRRHRRCDRRLGLHGALAVAAPAATAALRRLERLGQLAVGDVAGHCRDFDLDGLSDAVGRILDFDQIAVHGSHTRRRVRHAYR